VANTYINFGYPIKHILKHCGVPRSSFYYKPTFGKKGRIPYAKFYDKKGFEISSTEVLESILTLFENKFVDYGYFKVYIYLRDEMNYTVSKHYVYNLMKTNDLLQKRYLQSSKKGLRNWVTNLIPEAQKPFVYFEFDIKFIWIAGKRKNIQVLTVLDVFSRWNLGHFIAFSIKKENVIALFDEIFKTYVLPKDISVRSDNGAQFIANQVQEYFKNKGVFQEFTKPATPQQDAHIDRVAGAILSLNNGECCLSEI
jgi:putative transposase